MNIQFYKYQGTGNDFVMIDNRDNNFDGSNHELINRLCDRKFGVGTDGLILLENEEGYDFRMIYFNADGREGSMCGNGGRCIVQFAHDLGVIREETTFIAVDGEHEAKIENGLVHLKMQDVSAVEVENGNYFLSTGSPHYVQYVDNLSGFDVYENGRGIRYNDRFISQGTNVNFVEKTDDGIFVRTYERGVEDETLSCGTGVTACAITMFSKNGATNIPVKTLGGDLRITFEHKGNNSFHNIFLIGPAQQVFKGEVVI